MSYSPPTFQQFEITRNAAAARASINFLLEREYTNIAENIRPGSVEINNDDMLVHEEGVRSNDLKDHGIICWRSAE
jgi:hypothetical protein